MKENYLLDISELLAPKIISLKLNIGIYTKLISPNFSKFTHSFPSQSKLISTKQTLCEHSSLQKSDFLLKIFRDNL